MKLSAAQHVSGILTRKQSPRMEAGFQTMFYSRDLLGPDEVRVIEGQAQNASLTNAAAKWQSYRLGSDRHVISRIVSIPEPDEFGRRGRFFTNSLIFNVRGVDAFDDRLFDLFRCEVLHLTLNQLLASESLLTGNVQPVWVETRTGWVSEAESLARAWPGDQLNALFMLMADPSALSARGEFVDLLGNEEQILNALKVAFLLTPSDSRQFCSFDTSAGVELGQKSVRFWGRGCHTATDASYVIDAIRRRVICSESVNLLGESSAFMQLSAVLRASIAERLNLRSPLQKHFHKSYGAFIAESVYQTLLEKPEIATADDLQRLIPFAQANMRLELLLAIMQGDEHKRLRILASMELQPYKELVSELRDVPGFKPWQMFAPIFIPTWLDLFDTDYSLDDLTSAASNVAHYGSEEERIQLATLADHLGLDERQALRSWLLKSSLGLTELRAALEKSVNEKPGDKSAGKPNSLLRRVLHPFGR